MLHTDPLKCCKSNQKRSSSSSSAGHLRPPVALATLCTATPAAEPRGPTCETKPSVTFAHCCRHEWMFLCCATVGAAVCCQASCSLARSHRHPPRHPLSGFVRVSAHHWQLKALGTVPLVVPEKCQSFWRRRGLHRRRRKAQMALMDEQNPTEGPGRSHTGAPSK